jgi:predicted metal-binding membrane protein
MATLGLAGACWVVTLQQMNGMDMGVATQLGSFGSFLVMWVPMMAAMMLPGTVQAVSRHAHIDHRMRTVPLFLGLYLGVWTLVGVAIYALYRPHGAIVAGGIVIAAGLYELTRFKQECRRRCRESIRSGFNFGIYCLGSSIGLMLMLVGIGVMSVTWMAVISGLIVAQKLLPPKPAVDLPLALGIIGLGILILVDPSSVPGLLPSM